MRQSAAEPGRVKKPSGSAARRCRTSGSGLPVAARLVPVAAVLRVAQAVVDLLADRAHGELLRVAARDPDLAAERHDGLAGQGALEDLLLAHVVREALVVTGLLELLTDLLALDRGRARAAQRLRLVLEGVGRHRAHVASVGRTAAASSSRAPAG